VLPLLQAMAVTACSARISGHSRRCCRATTFEIELMDDADQRRRVHRCYADFAALASALELDCGSAPRLPPRRSIKRFFSEKQAIQHMDGLVYFLNVVLGSEAALQTDVLREFLDIPREFCSENTCNDSMVSGDTINTASISFASTANRWCPLQCLHCIDEEDEDMDSFCARENSLCSTRDLSVRTRDSDDA